MHRQIGKIAAQKIDLLAGGLEWRLGGDSGAARCVLMLPPGWRSQLFDSPLLAVDEAEPQLAIGAVRQAIGQKNLAAVGKRQRRGGESSRWSEAIGSQSLFYL